MPAGQFIMEGNRSTQPPNSRDDATQPFNCNLENFFFPILDTSSLDQGSNRTYIQLHQTIPDHVDPLYSSAPGFNITQTSNLNRIYIKKTYVKASVDEEFIYDDPENVFCGLGFPRAIMKLASRLYINTSTYLGNKDAASPYNKVTAISAAEDFAILAYLGGGSINKELHEALVPLFQHYYAMWMANGNLNFAGGVASPVLSPAAPAQGHAVNIDGGTLTQDFTTFGSFADLRKAPFNKEISPKAACPGFAAVPVESQQFVYGPWMNYPDLQRHKIFPHLNDTQRLSAIENMIGASHVVPEPDFLPENYGGMYLLDQVASEALESETSYQQKIESGSISIPGLPLFSLGDELSKYGSSLSYYAPVDASCIGYGVMRKRATVTTGPNITNITVQMNRSPETRYTFRTYTSKLNIFNKQNVRTIRLAAQKQQKMRRDFFNQINTLEAKNNKKLSMFSSFRDKFYSNMNGESVTSTSSPVEVLVGNVFDHASRITGASSLSYATRRSNIGLFDTKEIPRELTSSYSLKSFMSLDGFYSPVSFFPTKWGHTIPYAKFEKAKCPVCNGTKKYKEIKWGGNAGEPVTSQSEVDVYCIYCEDSPFYKNRSTSSKKARKPCIPPFILSSGIRVTTSVESGGESSGGNTGEVPGGNTGGGSVAVRESTSGDPTETVIYEYISDKNLIQNPKNFLSTLNGGDGVKIDLINLNPIISVSGVFRNANAGKEDFSGHCIEVVGRGYVSPPKSLRIPDDIVEGAVVGNGVSGSTRVPRTENAATQSLDKVVGKPFLDIDYDSYDQRRLLNNTITKIPQLNQRFFSFKGPMVLHGWGYDTEGYPVPNASGNPINSGIYKPNPTTGALWRTRSLDVQGSNDINDADYGDIVVGQNMKWVTNSSDTSSGTGTDGETSGGGGYWTEPYKEKEFLDGWGVKQDQWPVGPIDLRWDYDRRVWVANNDNTQYDNVYVVLEEDLILEQNSRNSYPARGFLDDLDFDKEPIPSGTRRVVFVKDRSGYTAPRGAKLLCSYNNNSGFYEPISKQNIICSGIIRQGLSADIFANYAEPSSGMIQNVTQTTIQFLNNLNLDVKPNHRAMFVYMDGTWNLLSIGNP